MRLDRTIGALTALVVGAVTALAFAQSFHALRGFAEAHGVVPAGWGWMFAATIDGFVLAALLTSLSLSLQEDRGAAPWAVRALAVTAAAISLVFNLQHVPAGMARWGAAVPPVAVLAGLEVLLLQVRRAVTRQGTAASLPPHTAATAHSVQSAWHAAAIEQPDPPALPAHGALDAVGDPNRAEAAPGLGEPQTEAVPVSLPGMPEADSAEAAARQQARQLYDRVTAAGQHVTGAALGRAIGRSERYGRLLLAEFRARDDVERHDGDGRQNPNSAEGRS
jgi:Protein of unknown function (DUF2637)